MKRRQFLAATAAATLAPELLAAPGCGQKPSAPSDRAQASTYATPADARRSPRETLCYVTCTYAGTPIDAPDFLAVVDVDPQSPTYCQVVHRAAMPTRGDELHHFGWNACSSCHGHPELARRYLVVPGLVSGRIHVLDASNARSPALYKVIEARQIAEQTNLSAPHTVHCLPDGRVMLSMLGDAEHNAPGGFLLLDQQFDIVGRWPADPAPRFNYDFWYQPRHNVMVSSEWAAPKTVRPGFNPDDVAAGKYGDRLYFWDWTSGRLIQTAELGQTGQIPLEVRFHHNPDSSHGYVGAALSSTIWHWHHDGQQWQTEQVVAVDSVEQEGWPFPVPGLITDLLISLDDRWLYFSNWLHGDIRQYDISNPSQPRLAGQVWCGGVLGRKHQVGQRWLVGGPQMLQLSLDGRRLYVTNSLYSSWDNQFYPDIATQGSHMLQIDCDTQQGGMKINERFLVDFGAEPAGPVRAHEMRFPGGDSTSDIWV